MTSSKSLSFSELQSLHVRNGDGTNSSCARSASKEHVWKCLANQEVTGNLWIKKISRSRGQTFKNQIRKREELLRQALAVWGGSDKKWREWAGRLTRISSILLTRLCFGVWPLQQCWSFCAKPRASTSIHACFSVLPCPPLPPPRLSCPSSLVYILQNPMPPLCY